MAREDSSVMSSLQQEQQRARLALQRDRQLTRVEGHRILLSALLGTLLIGAVLLYGLLLLPEDQRREQMVAQLNQANAEQRSGHERERDQLESRIAALQSELGQVRAQRDAARRPPAPRETTPQRGGPPRPQQSATAEKPCVNDNDPLCFSLNRRPSR
jgi:hypothetical protein